MNGCCTFGRGVTARAIMRAQKKSSKDEAGLCAEKDAASTLGQALRASESRLIGLDMISLNNIIRP